MVEKYIGVHKPGNLVGPGTREPVGVHKSDLESGIREPENGEIKYGCPISIKSGQGNYFVPLCEID
jgi:hypothetical protein